MSTVHMEDMKTTIEVSDSLLLRAESLAREQNVTLRTLIEWGLRRVIAEHAERASLLVKPVVFGGNGMTEEFEGATWERLRSAAYEVRGR